MLPGRLHLQTLDDGRNQFSAVKRLSPARCRRALNSSDSMDGFERVTSKPMLRRLSLEMLHEQIYFASGDFLGKRNEHIGLTQISIVFEYFIFEDEMVPERVPR